MARRFEPHHVVLAVAGSMKIMTRCFNSLLQRQKWRAVEFDLNVSDSLMLRDAIWTEMKRIQEQRTQTSEAKQQEEIILKRSETSQAHSFSHFFF